MFHAQELGSYAQGQGSLAVFKVTARDQGNYKGFRGHLLHTVTFLVFFFLNFIISFKNKHHVIAILNQNSLLVALATSESLKPSDCCVFITTCVENLLQYVISLSFFFIIKCH